MKISALSKKIDLDRLAGWVSQQYLPLNASIQWHTGDFEKLARLRGTVLCGLMELSRSANKGDASAAAALKEVLVAGVMMLKTALDLEYDHLGVVARTADEWPVLVDGRQRTFAGVEDLVRRLRLGSELPVSPAMQLQQDLNIGKKHAILAVKYILAVQKSFVEFHRPPPPAELFSDPRFSSLNFLASTEKEGNEMSMRIFIPNEDVVRNHFLTGNPTDDEAPPDPVPSRRTDQDDQRPYRALWEEKLEEITQQPGEFFPVDVPDPVAVTCLELPPLSRSNEVVKLWTEAAVAILEIYFKCRFSDIPEFKDEFSNSGKHRSTTKGRKKAKDSSGDRRELMKRSLERGVRQVAREDRLPVN